jgi:hypothetical protein
MLLVAIGAAFAVLALRSVGAVDRRLSMIQHVLALILVADEAEAGFELGGRSVVRLKIGWLELTILALSRLEIGSTLGWEGRAGRCR